MRNSVCLIVVFFLLSACTKKTEEKIMIVPEPAEVTMHDGSFVLNSNTVILFKTNDPLFNKTVQKSINEKIGFPLEKTKKRGNSIVFELDLSILNKSVSEEAYTLIVHTNQIIIKAATTHGLFYGLQSLLQLIPEKNTRSYSIPALEINDYPRFQYRGMHLDVCRHFFSVDFVKKYIDFIAMHKMNTFHWHLTEDQGWRIAIDKYPKLAEISAFRTEKDGKTYGGFYTKEEIKEIIQYASERFVTIIPEIEMPGHSLAALAAYPELSCTGGPFKVANEWGVFHDVYCAGKEETFVFLQNVLDEVIELFPSEYIHIGGDESPKNRWEKCPDCQRRIKQEGLKNEHELQSYFIKRIEKYLNSKNKKLIGWDEILEGGLAPAATVMSWRGESGGIAAAKQGHDVIMTPNSHCYFDHYQGDPEIEPLAIGGFTDLEKVYHYEPIPKQLSETESQHVLGAQANLWTEYIASNEHVEYMVLPRMSALAEVLWTPIEKRNWLHFQDKLEKLYLRFDEMKANYHIPAPGGLFDLVIYTDTAIVEFKSPLKNTEIRYTIDGTEPGKNSLLYKNPIKTTENITIKAVTLLQNNKKSAIRSIKTEKQEMQVAHQIENLLEGLDAAFYLKSFSSCNDIKGTPDNLYVSKNFDIPQDHLKDNFAVRFTGYINAPQTGIYAFQTGSDDGSVLFINGKLVVDNDGFHSYAKKYGQIALQKGLHKIEVRYFEGSGSNYLYVYWKPPGAELKRIPGDVLYREKLKN